MFRPVVVVLIAMCGVCAVSAGAAAQDAVDPPTLVPRMTASASAIRVDPAVRGPMLPALYVGLIGLQAYDGYSTSRGLKNGAIESNTIMGSLATHPGALWAAKGGTAFASIYMAERLWRQHHRGEAIALMVVSNSIMAAVAASNASVIRAQK